MTADILQCGNLAIFLPFWIYIHVKSILALADFRRSKTPVLTIFEGFKFSFLEKSHTWKCQMLPNFKIQNAQLVKMAGFWGVEMTKTDFA